MTRLRPLRLCFQGFAAGSRPVLTIRTPGGKRTEWPGAAVIGTKFYQWSWDDVQAADLLARPGTYPFTITAAGTAATHGIVVVKPATEPAVVYSKSRGLRAGDSVTAVLAGFKPGTRLLASTYGPVVGDKLHLMADLPAVVADSNGEGVIRWKIPGKVTPGRYAIYIESLVSPTNECRPPACRFIQVVR